MGRDPKDQGDRNPSDERGPSRMGEAIFVETFGKVFEHSPWVARAAHRAGLGQDADTADGLHARMVKAMREGTREQQLALIVAHPDLAGKLAQAGRLTAESAGEQSSAGLDRLTDHERETFTTLNEAYRAKFGFPFIIAVRGLGKTEILRAFETRLVHTQEAEFATALDQIERIALIRLRDMLPTA